MNELENIEEFLRKVKFQKQAIGGVSESDALAKLQQISDLYAQAFKIQEAKYQATLEEKNRELRRLRGEDG